MSSVHLVSLRSAVFCIACNVCCGYNRYYMVKTYSCINFVTYHMLRVSLVWQTSSRRRFSVCVYAYCSQNDVGECCICSVWVNGYFAFLKAAPVSSVSFDPVCFLVIIV